MNRFIEKDFNNYSNASFPCRHTIAAQINIFQKDYNCEFISILSSFYNNGTTYTKVLFKLIEKNENSN